MFGIHRYVKAADGQFDGWVFPVKPGRESEAIELLRTVVDRLAKRVGRGEDRPEMLGLFVAGDTVQNVIPDGTHEPFIAEVLAEYIRHKKATRNGAEQDEAEVDPFVAEVMAEVRRHEAAMRRGEEQNETEV